MSTVISNAVKQLTSMVNLSTGLDHPSDMISAKAVFALLHEKGEILLKSEVESEAIANNWPKEDADQLGALAQQIGMGKSPRLPPGQHLGNGFWDLVKED